ncbi:hypothetical protein A2415_00040 [candidate division WWE3 bacterium RIFOXYC1_FULL_39_7]|uniref:Uncharacterized protein n=1 Tax=candidate division WWE3 bacterium RIFOXYC1_FULL_39_7 TaxID=1802643 RepID=A0A1F4WGL9_UNCKA|nr:MAG: hypothetical protein A2415_00040 [candidate division WWE3 bacterium RIFOXYC1_FULL_39_7]
MSKNKITKPKTTDEMREVALGLRTGFEASYILEKLDEEHKSLKKPKEVSSDSYLYKSMTLFEFDKGVLLLNAIPELHRIFALEFNKNLQKEFDCKTPSEKSLAEVLALNWVRILSTQQSINAYLAMKTINQNGIGYLNVLSKELDRAERHYLTSLQTLKMLKMLPMKVNIKTQTAIVGQNQVVQANNQND